MTWRRKIMWVVAVVLLVELAVFGMQWWWRPAPLPQAGMLGKEPVRYLRIADKINYAKLKESKYQDPRTPEQAIYEFFVAMNRDDWERFKHITVGRDRLAAFDPKLKTEEEQHKFMTVIGQMGKHGVRVVVTHLIQHRGDWYVAVTFNPDGWPIPVAFPLVQKWGSWRIDVSDPFLKQNPLGKDLGDHKLLEKLK